MKRRELHLRLTCGLIGVLLAICWAMIHRQCNSDRTRVYIEESLPLAVIGLVCGAWVGWVLQLAVTSWQGVAPMLELLLVTSLAARFARQLGRVARGSD